MLEFAGLDAGLRCGLLAQMSKLAVLEMRLPGKRARMACGAGGPYPATPREERKRPAITQVIAGRRLRRSALDSGFRARPRYPPAARHCRSCSCAWPGRSEIG